METPKFFTFFPLQTFAVTVAEGNRALLTLYPSWRSFSTFCFNGRLRDSRESSGFDDSHDLLDDALPQAMTAPVSPSVPLSASSHSDGWKYSSQKLLWKLKPRYINFSHASSTSSSTDSAWKSLDSVTWRSVDGAEVVLRGARLEALSEIERGALRLVALQRLAVLLPGVSLVKPKDPLIAIRQKRQKLLKPNKALNAAEVNRRASGYSVDSGQFMEPMSLGTGRSGDKRLFGVSLVTCMQNERRLDLESRCRSLDDSACATTSLPPGGCSPRQHAKSVRSEPEIVALNDRKWLYPSTQNLYPDSNPSSPSPYTGSAPPTCSLPVKDFSLITHPPEPEKEIVTGRFVKKQRPSSASFSYSLDAPSTDDVDPHTLQVPRIVENCTQYLMAYGLTSVGLFRVAGNAKRCRQLRSTLEKVGGGTAISDELVENTTAHDVATLLKEYFRDLPQSLLPREHYQAYITAARESKIHLTENKAETVWLFLGFPVEERIEVVRLLVSLLGPPNIDTLFVLLKFLHEVTLHCHDQVDSADAEQVTQGNRMDARNLATIFAPSILRPDHGKLHATLAENEQQIAIVETMIAHVEEVFRIPKELQCKIYNKLRDTDPDRLDRFLNHVSRVEGSEHPLTSPFPATTEEVQRECHSPAEHVNGKELLSAKVCSQRSGSWPFSLARSPRQQRFFPADSACPSTSSCPSDDNEFKEPWIRKQYAVHPDISGRARSPSRERDFREAARHSAAAARRRLCNVVRAFRFSSVTRSSPNVADC
ncbi:RhoGAP domain protein [Ancylostoma ceylanicum]|uniref:RhoGAP domain protein n=1 Tax=Ancylostoma ceylanicum TaxID=53326 RepID=A0A0D6M402_9BILA|nr:RhoGAP domain protein [Ancylostoma ceylanicum]